MDTKKKRIIAGAIIVGLFLTGTGTTFASNDSLPGDMLYPVKRALERAQVSLALSDNSRAEAEFAHASERLREVETLRARLEMSQEGKERAEIRERVRAASDDTSAELEQAFLSLSRVYATLFEKGNTQAAAAIENNINRLLDDSRKARFEVRVENEGGVERVRVRLSDSDDDDSSEDFQGRGRGSDDVNDGSSTSSSSSSNTARELGTSDVRESADEIFCRGEWRDPEDCAGERTKDLPSFDDSSSGSSSSSNDGSDNSSSSSSSNSSANSTTGAGTPDVRERESEVFCRGEWRDPADCRGEPITTPPAGAGTAPSASTGGVQGTTDVKERPDQVLCDGEWRDPEDCARR